MLDYFENMYETRNTIFEYVRDRKNKPIGVILSTVIDNTVCFGWSLCKVNEEDFNKDIAMQIAFDRCFCNGRYEKYINYADYEPVFEFVSDILPDTIAKSLPRFVDRVRRYYKNEKLSDILEYIVMP